MQRHIKKSFALFIIVLFLIPATPFSSGLAREPLKFESDDTIEEMREKIEHNGYNFTVDHNWVYDMSREQKEIMFRRTLPMFPRGADISDDIGPLARYLGRQLPAEFDWRNYGGHTYIGPVRNQGDCGSCYAFGACAAAEGTYNVAMNMYDNDCADFSESFIIWCLGSIEEYNSHFYGCEGTDYDYYELEALTGEGIIDESAFPYTTVDPGSCTHWEDRAINFSSWHRITCSDIDAIKTAIMTYGVVDAAVWVTSAFQAYSGGIYEDASTTCPETPCYYTETNHCIALVGWNDNGGDGYWILRNSWGTDWGEAGYMRIKFTSARVACEVAYFEPGNWATASTEATTSISAHSATLNGTVNPGGEDTTCLFAYGTTSDYGLSTTGTVVSGTADVAVSADISGLDANTMYHCRVEAENTFGTVDGNDETFTTPAAPPLVSTGSASSITSGSATLNGTVNPNNSDTTYYFEYGTTTDYGSTTANQTASGLEDVPADATVEGLSAATAYHFRLAAANTAGTTYGSDETFTTGTGSGGDGGGGGGCFIATAAYGSPMEQHVTILKEFRDKYLITNRVGATLVNRYYKFSPPLSRCISQHDTLRALVRISLLPAIVICRVILTIGPIPVMLFFLLLILSLGTYLVKKGGGKRRTTSEAVIPSPRHTTRARVG